MKCNFGLWSRPPNRITFLECNHIFAKRSCSSRPLVAPARRARSSRPRGGAALGGAALVCGWSIVRTRVPCARLNRRARARSIDRSIGSVSVRFRFGSVRFGSVQFGSVRFGLVPAPVPTPTPTTTPTPTLRPRRRPRRRLRRRPRRRPRRSGSRSSRGEQEQYHSE